MPRKRDPRRDEAFEIWKSSDGQKKLKDIAAHLGVSDSQMRKWKSQDKWDAQTKGNVTNSKRSVTKPKKKLGGQPGNKGNPHPTPKFAKRNNKAETHGFFSKYIPDEAREIMEGMEERSVADLIYDQIQIQYAAIIRAQRIMFVESKQEMIKELKKAEYEIVPDGDDFKQVPTMEEYEFQFAWERHATFLNAQSRAMSELRSLIKQFNEMAHDDDERRLKLQQMQLGIEKTKADIDVIQNGGNSEETEVWVEGLKEIAKKRRQVKQDEQ